jgi:hypothetical protein
VVAATKVKQGAAREDKDQLLGETIEAYEGRILAPNLIQTNSQSSKIRMQP